MPWYIILIYFIILFSTSRHSSSDSVDYSQVLSSCPQLFILNCKYSHNAVQNSLPAKKLQKTFHLRMFSYPVFPTSQILSELSEFVGQ